jgi:hypothetical protein
MSNTATPSSRFSSFTDLAEVYAEMTATPEFRAAFGDVGALSIVEGSRDAEELGMPDPLEAQHECAAIVSTIFDLLRDTRLEASAQAIAWGIVNSFHHEAQKLDRTEDSMARELGDMARRPDPSEVFNSELEELQLRCQTVQEQARAIECMRDYAAEMYRAQTGRPWSAARGSKVSTATTASQIAVADFMKARANAARERFHPTGPLVVCSGGQEWHDWQMIWDRLDQIKTRVPTMTLCTTAQRKGADAIAAAWAASRGVALVAYVPDRRMGARAGFVRNEKMAALKPIEAIVCQGSGLQANLLDVLKGAGIPTHAFRADAQTKEAPARMTA